MSITEEQFLQLLQKHKGILYKICKIYVNDLQDQQDLLQEIVLQLWSSYDSFREESQFSSWMYRVALNTAITFYKRERQRNEYLTSLSGEELAMIDVTDVTEDHREQLAILYKAMQELNKVEKALFFVHGGPVRESDRGAFRYHATKCKSKN